MKIKLKEIPIREVVKSYLNDDEEGVTGYGGDLNIRPRYQREFVYKDKQRDAVVATVTKNFPLNVLYWVKNKDATFEVLDGQQRLISVCEYIDGTYSINHQFFHNLTDEEQEQILNYKLMVYFCEGDEREKLDWFKTINIAGEKLTDQELRNAIYTGEWLSDAKKYFSKTDCVAYKIGSDYVRGTPIRQDYLETVLKWVSSDDIEVYMAQKQGTKNAKALWVYFEKVIGWVTKLFPFHRKEMKGVDWGGLYNKYKNTKLDPIKLEAEVRRLMMDEDVTKKSGIYPYLFTNVEKHLSIRAFSKNQIREVYEAQKGICPKCDAPDNHYEIEEMEADHVTPWSKGGTTTAANCKMLCKSCNRSKSDK
jgi:hypothetical protein